MEACRSQQRALAPASLAVQLLLMLATVCMYRPHAGVSAQCVECQLLLSQQAASQPAPAAAAGIIIIIIIITRSLYSLSGYVSSA